jgi:hypothetical protein
MRTLKVGELLEPGVTEFKEMPEYNYRSGSHRLIIAMKNIRRVELLAVKSVPARFAFTVIGDVLVFQYRFGTTLPWSDAAYTWHKVPAAEQVRPPKLTGKQRILLEIVLVEAKLGIIEALRAVSLSPTFSQRLHKAINAQADAPMPADYDAQVQHIFDTFTSAQLRDRAIASCTGGDDIDRDAPY